MTEQVTLSGEYVMHLAMECILSDEPSAARDRILSRFLKAYSTAVGEEAKEFDRVPDYDSGPVVGAGPVLADLLGELYQRHMEGLNKLSFHKDADETGLRLSYDPEQFEVSHELALLSAQLGRRIPCFANWQLSCDTHAVRFHAQFASAQSPRLVTPVLKLKAAHDEHRPRYALEASRHSTQFPLPTPQCVRQDLHMISLLTPSGLYLTDVLYAAIQEDEDGRCDGVAPLEFAAEALLPRR